MQRLYLYILIAAVVLSFSYSDTIRNFFSPTDRGMKETAQEDRPAPASDDSYEQLKIEIYRIATTLSDLQGKAQLLRMAKENREWFTEDDYNHLDDLIETTEQDLAAAESTYEEVKKEFTRATVQMMLKRYTPREQQPTEKLGGGN